MSYKKRLIKALTDDDDIGVEFLLIANLGAFVVLFVLVIIGVLLG